MNDDSKEAIQQAGGIPALVSLLESPSQGARESAAGALCNLALSYPNKRDIAASGAVTPLVQMLGSPEAGQVSRQPWDAG